MPFAAWTDDEDKENEDFYTEDDSENEEDEIFEIDTGEWEALTEDPEDSDGESDWEEKIDEDD